MACDAAVAPASSLPILPYAHAALRLCVAVLCDGTHDSVPHLSQYDLWQPPTTTSVALLSTLLLCRTPCKQRVYQRKRVATAHRYYYVRVPQRSQRPHLLVVW